MNNVPSPFENQVLRRFGSRVLVPAAAVRAAMVNRDDVRNLVGFQNDVNTIINTLDVLFEPARKAGSNRVQLLTHELHESIEQPARSRAHSGRRSA